MLRSLVWMMLSAAICLSPTWLLAVDFVRLSEGNWKEHVPQGKEVDAIYGDFVLRNELLVAVVAQPLKTRNANMTVRAVGGYVIDLTERQVQSDQLSAYFPGSGRYEFIDAAKLRLSIDGQQRAEEGEFAPAHDAKSVTLEFESEALKDRLHLTVRYTLAEGAPFLLVETIYTNPTGEPVEDEPSDAIRADRSFSFGIDGSIGLFWADDEWFRQAYGVLADGYELKMTGERARVLQFVKDGSPKLRLAPGESHTIARKLFPASSLLALRGRASELAGGSGLGRVTIKVMDPRPVAQAKVTLARDGRPYASGRSNAEGLLVFSLPAGDYAATIESTDGRRVTATIGGGADSVTIASLPAASYVAGTITADGKPCPAKISFTGKNGAKDPDWGPETGEVAVKNLYYTHNGSFQQPIAPGEYDVIVSYGPEHDAVFTSLTVPPGAKADLKADLKRSVDTTGWISADFHNHSSPSGDNTSSQFGRVLNILCEHVEFAPCTEHNRIDSYVPHLKRLGVEHLVATCTGMELTGGPLPVNHQNAFPLHHHPHTQDGGAPVTDIDPVVQIERLALWDNKSDKLVQMNHPNLPQILGDRDLDGKPDAGFERMFGFVDVIEVHPPEGVFTPPEKQADGKLERNPIFHWMQMLNLGYNQPGVINTDSHYNFHESGFRRNFIKSPTDDPAQIDTLEVVHQSEHGHVVVSTGPFLSVAASAADGKMKRAIPGDDLTAKSGHVELAIKVQCPNWFDVNRVQIFVNGRPLSELNFTRRTMPDKFSNDGATRFEAKIPVELKTDAHLIVATIGEGLKLGPVMGPRWGEQVPVAVANPIFIDVDGSGFKPNGDLLGVELPIDLTKPITRRAHTHDHEH